MDPLGEEEKQDNGYCQSVPLIQNTL